MTDYHLSFSREFGAMCVELKVDDSANSVINRCEEADAIHFNDDGKHFVVREKNEEAQIFTEEELREYLQKVPRLHRVV